MSHSRVVVELDQWVTVRDGTRLATDVYRPDDDAAHPVLVHRSPYAKANGPAILDPIAAVREGYVVVMQESRGRLASEGTFTPFHHEADDGHDTVEWAAAQPWSTGAVGTFGASGNGASAAQLVLSAPPALRCAAVVHTGFNPYRGWVYADGTLELAFLHGWVRRFAGTVLPRLAVDDETRTRLEGVLAAWAEDPVAVIRALPLEDAFPPELSPFFHEWLAHPSYDDYWAAVDVVARCDAVRVPILHITGWYDGFLVSHMDFQRALQRHPDPTVRQESRLVVGPWDHHAYLSPTKSSWSGTRDFGGRALSGPALSAPLLLRWFARWVKDDHTVDTGPPVRYFVMGVREWREAPAWPPPTRETAWYLHRVGDVGSDSGGTLDPVHPSDEPSDSFRYDPLDPTPTTGGRHLGLEFAASGVADQSGVARRDDVLVYTSRQLDQAVEVA